MGNDFITRERGGEHADLGGRDYLWFALLLIVVLAGIAGS